MAKRVPLVINGSLITAELTSADMLRVPDGLSLEVGGQHEGGIVDPQAIFTNDWVSQGFLTPTGASLTGTMSTASYPGSATNVAIAYAKGHRVFKWAGDASLTYTYTASRDTYDDIDYNGTITHIAVANGAAAPAVTANSLRLQKVVTNASAITAVTQLADTAPTYRGGSGGAVSSVTGTGNQVTCTPVTGAVVVSLPAAITLPGTLSLGGTVTGGGYDLSGIGTVTPNAAGASDLGSTTKAWRNLFLTNSGNTTNYAQFSCQTLAGNRTVNIPDANSTTVQASTAGANQFATAINAATGAVTWTQPSFSNLSGSITLAQMPTMANNTVLGNVSGGSAVPAALTATQLTTIPNLFTSTLKGLVPLSGGGTSNFLRADGTWVAPTLSNIAWKSTLQTITSSGTLSFPHTLGVVPSMVQFRIECITAEAGYVAGEVIWDTSCNTNAGNRCLGCTVTVNATTVNVAYSNQLQVFAVIPKTGGAAVGITNTRWGLRVILTP